MLTSGEAHELSASPLFSGGWLMEGAGHLNALSYTRGVVRTAQSQGAQTFIESPVELIKKDGAR